MAGTSVVGASGPPEVRTVGRGTCVTTADIGLAGCSDARAWVENPARIDRRTMTTRRCATAPGAVLLPIASRDGREVIYIMAHRSDACCRQDVRAPDAYFYLQNQMDVTNHTSVRFARMILGKFEIALP